jgi:hypothetical protein
MHDDGTVTVDIVERPLPIHADRRTLREAWAYYLRNSPPAGSA